MAQALRFVCSHCGEAIEAWSDGNPYYLDERGRKQYAYHPDHERLSRCIGNDDPHICLSCGKRFKVDSRSPRAKCRTCSSAAISSTYDLDGKPCPFCHNGHFGIDPDFHCIS